MTCWRFAGHRDSYILWYILSVLGVRRRCRKEKGNCGLEGSGRCDFLEAEPHGAPSDNTCYLFESHHVCVDVHTRRFWDLRRSGELWKVAVSMPKHLLWERIGVHPLTSGLVGALVRGYAPRKTP